MKKKTGKVSIGNILFLQLVVMLYTGSGIMAKFASSQELFSPLFFMFYGGELAVLGVYAVLWQQVIKRFQLSVAYANRAMALVWSLLWAAAIFHDRVTIQNLAGAALVIAGTIIVNKDVGEERT